MTDTLEDAVESLSGDEPRLLLIAEHASLRLPEPWRWPASDQWLVGTHWSYDLGVAEVTRDLARTLRAPARLARFSRLLIDPNRDLDSPTLFRAEAEGRAIELNRGLDAAERARRIDHLYRPYHAAIDRALAATPEAAILSIHSFSRHYEGFERELELGVLFDTHRELGHRFAACLKEHGWRCATNQPYSGHDGFAFSPEHHGATHGRPCLEIEVRQDIATDPQRRPRVVEALVAAITATFI